MYLLVCEMTIIEQRQVVLRRYSAICGLQQGLWVLSLSDKLKYIPSFFCIERWLFSVCAGNGYCRSEAIVAVYLQKKESAKRIYATLIHSKTNADGFKDQGNFLFFVFCDDCCLN